MYIRTQLVLAAFVSVFCASNAYAECRDSVVLVHGNGDSSSAWSNTVSELTSRGWSSSDIYTPNWGGPNPSFNNHSGSEETPVRNALNTALNNSCTGQIDVIGHSMGVTLAAKQILELDIETSVDSFVGIAAGYRGLWSCGYYPWNVYVPTCGAQGLSVSSPLLDSLENETVAARVYTIKSYSDQVVCSTGTCFVSGKHSSQMPFENQSYTYPYGHFGLKNYTASLQVDLIE